MNRKVLHQHRPRKEWVNPQKSFWMLCSTSGSKDWLQRTQFNPRSATRKATRACHATTRHMKSGFAVGTGDPSNRWKSSGQKARGEKNPINFFCLRVTAYALKMNRVQIFIE